jgi:hypothetical protein
MNHDLTGLSLGSSQECSGLSLKFGPIGAKSGSGTRRAHIQITMIYSKAIVDRFDLHDQHRHTRNRLASRLADMTPLPPAKGLSSRDWFDDLTVTIETIRPLTAEHSMPSLNC